MSAGFGSADQNTTRLMSLARSLQTADRIISGQPIVLKFAKGLAYPGLTVGNQIQIDAGRVRDPFSHRGTATILGVNYHELAHAMYTSCIPQELWAAYKASKLSSNGANRPTNWDTAFLMLEEARVETVIGAKYPRMRRYFAAAVAEFLTDQNQWKVAFLLTHGRKYLPQDIRDDLRNKFVEANYSKKNDRATQRRIEKYSELIDKYRLLALTDMGSMEQGGECVYKFALLLKEDGIDITPPHSVGTPSPDATSEEGQRNQNDDTQTAKEKDGTGDDGGDAAQDGDGGKDQPSKPEDGSDGGEGDGGAGGEDPGDASSSEGSQTSERSDSDSEESSNGVGNQSAQDTSTKGSDSTPDLDLASALKELIEESLSSEEVLSEVSGFHEAMNDTAAGLGTVLPPIRWGLSPVTPQMVQQSDRVAMALRLIWARMEAGWEYDLPEGNRIDMQRAALAVEPEDYDTIYVEWSPGQQENAGLEAAVLGDRSSSMDGRIDQYGYRSPTKHLLASMGVWELRRALLEVDAKTTSLSFNSACNVLYDRDEGVDPGQFKQLGAAGGTDPLEALREVRRIMLGTEQPNKLLVMFTDGDWSQDQEIPDILSAMHDVVKVAILIGFNGNRPFRYSRFFDIVENTTGDILDPMAQSVVRILERNADR